MLLGVILLLHPFSGFSLWSLAIKARVLGHPNSVGYGVYFGEWALNLIRQWLVALATPGPLCINVSCRQVTVVEYMAYSGIYHCLSPVIAYRVVNRLT